MLPQSRMMFSFLFVFAAFLVSAQSAESNDHRVDVLTAELHFQPFDYSALVRRNKLTEPGFRFGHWLFGQFDIGTNNPTFKMSMETGAVKLFAFDKDYEGTNRPHSWPTYNYEASTTAVPKNEAFNMTTGGVVVKGNSYTDQVTYLGMANNLTVGSVLEFPFSDEYPLDGVVGLGWDPESDRQPGPDAPFAVNLLKRYPPAQRAYSININECSGYIQWGTDYGGHSTPVHSVGGVPAIYIDQIKFGNFENHIKTSAIIDTGYSTLSLPLAIYRVVLSALQPKHDPDTGLLVVDCSEKAKRPPKFVFTIGTEEYEVRGRHYVLDKDFPGEKCILAVSPSSDNVVRLGMPFIQTVSFTFRLAANEISMTRRSIYVER